MSPAHLHQYVASISPGQISESLPSSQVMIYFSTLQHLATLTRHVHTHQTQYVYTRKQLTRTRTRTLYTLHTLYTYTLYTQSVNTWQNESLRLPKHSYINTHTHTQHIVVTSTATIRTFVVFVYRLFILFRLHKFSITFSVNSEQTRMHDATGVLVQLISVRLTTFHTFFGMIFFCFVICNLVRKLHAWEIVLEAVNVRHQNY